MTTPTCHNCSKPLTKKTVTVEFWHNHENPPRSLADCRRLTNLEVVSVRYWTNGAVRHFSTWDGTSYQGHYDYFCTIQCAAQFGRLMARRGAHR